MIYTWKLSFALLLSHFLVNLNLSIDKVVSVQFSQHRWTCVDSTFLSNIIPTLKQHWVINIESTQLYQRCFVNVKTTSINKSRLNFHCQSNFNVESRLIHRRWIDVILSELLQRCFVNVETTSINVRWLNFHFQPNINVDERWRSTLFQRWFNVDVLAGFRTDVTWRITYQILYNILMEICVITWL